MLKPLPSIDILHSVFDLDAEKGQLVWRHRSRDMFANQMQFARWNKHYAGMVAGRITAAGYRNIKVLGASYQAHRLIWKMATGEEPGEIDHINRDKADNRIANLRVVSRSLNMRNKGLHPRNTSGERHIHWMPRLSKWTVQLLVPGKGQRQLAYTDTLEEAVAARNALYKQYGYDGCDK